MEISAYGKDKCPDRSVLVDFPRRREVLRLNRREIAPGRSPVADQPPRRDAGAARPGRRSTTATFSHRTLGVPVPVDWQAERAHTMGAAGSRRLGRRRS